MILVARGRILCGTGIKTDTMVNRKSEAWQNAEKNKGTALTRASRGNVLFAKRSVLGVWESDAAKEKKQRNREKDRNKEGISSARKRKKRDSAKNKKSSKHKKAKRAKEAGEKELQEREGVFSQSCVNVLFLFLDVLNSTQSTSSGKH